MRNNATFANPQTQNSFEKILVIQTASIGDVILATPVIEQLHTCYPNARIDFLLKKGIESVFTGHPFLNDVLVWDKNQGKYRNLYGIFRRIRKQRYDLIVNIHRFFTSGFITAFSGAKVRIGFDKNPFSWSFTHRVKHLIGSKGQTIHEVERNALLLKDICADHVPKIRLYPTDNDQKLVSDWISERFITISPASLWFTKQLPAAQWLELIRAVGSHYRIFLLGGKADRPLCDQIIRDAKQKNIVNLAGKLSFLQSAALMQSADMNFVNDSAPMHLASAVYAPVAAVYCSTVPAFGFGPRSDKSFVIETEEELPCRPCGLHGQKSCPKKHFKCATTIKPEQLLKTLKIESFAAKVSE